MLQFTLAEQKKRSKIADLRLQILFKSAGTPWYNLRMVIYPIPQQTVNTENDQNLPDGAV
jgi:hypothetical protein